MDKVPDAVSAVRPASRVTSIAHRLTGADTAYKFWLLVARPAAARGLVAPRLLPRPFSQCPAPAAARPIAIQAVASLNEAVEGGAAPAAITSLAVGIGLPDVAILRPRAPAGGLFAAVARRAASRGPPSPAEGRPVAAVRAVDVCLVVRAADVAGGRADVVTIVRVGRLRPQIAAVAAPPRPVTAVTSRGLPRPARPPQVVLGVVGPAVEGLSVRVGQRRPHSAAVGVPAITCAPPVPVAETAAEAGDEGQATLSLQIAPHDVAARRPPSQRPFCGPPLLIGAGRGLDLVAPSPLPPPALRPLQFLARAEIVPRLRMPPTVNTAPLLARSDKGTKTDDAVALLGHRRPPP